MANITIDGTNYELESLSDNARAQLSSLQVAEQEISQLHARLAMTQTARNAYGKALAESLPEEASTEASEGVVYVNKRPYLLEKFSDKAKADLTSLQLTDQKLAQLKSEVAITRTARNAYAFALKQALGNIQ